MKLVLPKVKNRISVTLRTVNEDFLVQINSNDTKDDIQVCCMPWLLKFVAVCSFHNLEYENLNSNSFLSSLPL